MTIWLMPKPSLRGHRDFSLLWGGQTISQFGTMINNSVALPLLAVIVLHASPVQMGVLTAAETAAFAVIGLPTGAWVDRVRRKPTMIIADLGRAALLTTIPVAWWLDLLTLTQLIVVSLLVGALTVFFDVAYQSYLPSLVGREHLGQGNARLQASQSVAVVSGPALGGLIVHALGAATTLLVDTVSFLISAAALWRIRTVERQPERSDRRLLADIAQGLDFVLRNKYLRAITACTATCNLFGGITSAMYVLFLARVLGLSAATIGLVIGASGIGGVLGALTAGWWHRAIGQARSIWLSILVTTPFALLIPLAGAGLPVWAAGVGYAVFGYGVVVYNVVQVSFRQAICPDHLLGRMNASVRFLVWGAIPLGGLGGGLLADAIGVRGALWVASVGMFLAVGWLLASPLMRLRDLPTPQAAQASL